ncbi:MAG: exosome complex protein Rrp42 [archaeon]
MEEELKEHINNSLKENIRLDGRKKEDFREITVETGIIKTAEGSARVKCGNTEVLAGIKLAVGTPFPDTPNAGVLMVGAELLPMSNPKFESGPPSIEAIEVARVIDRGIRESGTIDTKKLCIKKGEEVWMVMLDVIPLNTDGNLLDIGGLAAMAALLDCKMPSLKDGKPDVKNMTDKKLPLNDVPIPVTVVKIGDNFLLDPLESEENALDARLTVTSMEDGRICAMQKGGDSPLTTEDLKKMFDLSLKKSAELRKLIKR